MFDKEWTLKIKHANNGYILEYESENEEGYLVQHIVQNKEIIPINDRNSTLATHVTNRELLYAIMDVLGIHSNEDAPYTFNLVIKDTKTGDELDLDDNGNKLPSKVE